MDAPRSPRRSAPFLIGLIVILAALPLGYFFFLHQPPAPPPPTPAPPTGPEAPLPQAAPEKLPMALKLEEVRGTVEVRRGGGQWRTASVGEALHPSDAVRTREGSYAVIIGGEAVEVRMEAGAEISVEELTDSFRFLLGNGMTTARLKLGAGQTLEMKAAGSDAVARTEGGTFTMSNNGAGTVALATLVGEVAFSGQRKVVIVRAGQQSIIRPGRGPTEPTPIPSSLLLKVNWPAHPQRKVRVSGQTDPGNQVAMGGRIIPTDEEGRFSQVLPLREGPNSVQVQALSVGGLRQEEKRDLTLDTTPPSVKVDPGIWDDPPSKGQ
ncbi:hypothetical protein [Archangium lansingense]|uniref:FecR protein domain-containing protein n=1 Tax=Archangium lansingense TaxID=2995310 RepID=A0ABT4ACN2_9BACT|nr:hypothetical protein [Archangium lansinium]MCY1079390.1 hypothetical protein [Archangium lansinium]